MESHISPEILTYGMQNGKNIEDALLISWFNESEICCNFHWLKKVLRGIAPPFVDPITEVRQIPEK